jgi:hypothetical protein
MGLTKMYVLELKKEEFIESVEDLFKLAKYVDSKEIYNSDFVFCKDLNYVLKNRIDGMCGKMEVEEIEMYLKYSNKKN